MGKIIEIQYNGNLGYRVPISDVKESFKITLSDSEFLNTKNPVTGFSNRDLIFESYGVREKIELNLSDDEGNAIKDSGDIQPFFPCPVPIILYVDSENLTADILISQSNLLTNNFQVTSFGGNDEESSFIIEDNKFYNEVIRPNLFDDNPSAIIREGVYGIGQREAIQPTVWLWSKSSNEDGDFNPNSIFNLSPFIQNISINQSDNGGNFSIELLSIDGVFELENGEPTGIWHPNRNRYVKFSHDNRDNFVFRSVMDTVGSRKSENFEDVTYGDRFQNVTSNQVNIKDRSFKSGERDFNRTETLFKNMISENDIIFISFSDFEEDSVQYKDDFFINNSNLPDRDWQMIGLVDSNQLQVSYEDSSMTLNVSGRDCMKLLIEDGSYFFTKSFSNPDNTNSAFNNIDLPNRGDDNNASNITIQQQNTSGINRLVTTGLIDMLYNPESRNVNFIMNLLISRLSNIEICHSDLFQYYGSRRTQFSIPSYETVQSEDSNPNTRREEDE